MKPFSWLLLAAIPALASAQTTTVDKLVDDWLNLEIQKGHLQSNWNLRQDELERRLALLEVEKSNLKELLAKSNKAVSDLDQQRLELLESQERLEREQQSLDTTLNKLIKQAQALHRRLPPPLFGEWEEKFPLLLQEGVGNSEKLERLLALFKLVEEFNNRVALHQGTLDIPEQGSEARRILVSQIYLGASQGWYVSNDGKSYGYGRATQLGWTWWHGADADNELGKRLNPDLLLKAKAMLENPTSAEFVALPVKL